MSERVAVVGARRHPNLAFVNEYVHGLPGGTIIVSGGAEGTDTAARIAGLQRGFRVEEFVPDYGGDGPNDPSFVVRRVWTGCTRPRCENTRIHVGYGLRFRDVTLFRNTWIALADMMSVFPDGSAGGSYDAADQGVRFRRPVRLRWLDGRVESYAGRRR